MISRPIIGVIAVILSAQSQSLVTVSGSVTGGSAKHPIYVAVWDASGFLIKPVQQIRIDPGSPALFEFRVPPGPWALSAFEDVNKNGVLDMGSFGPKEPSGFWRPFHGWRKPRFGDVTMQIERDIKGAEIRIGR